MPSFARPAPAAITDFTVRLTVTEANKALAPFHRICTPMQTSRNDDNRRITLIAVAPRIRASRSANP